MTDKDEANIKAAIREMNSSMLRGIVKEAIKELVAENIKAFGWFSIKTISVAGIGGIIVFVLWANGWVQR